MKKQSIVNLIRCHAEHDEPGFRAEAAEIAREFDTLGDVELAEYVMSLISSASAFVPQHSTIISCQSPFLEKISTEGDMLILPEPITNDIIGGVNAVRKRIGANKFLFEGAPGTGKTEAAKQMARILDRELFIVNMAALVDSKLGQTAKNIDSLFRSIGGILQQDKIVILFDEIDAIALDRTNQQDLREMGRATSAMLKGFDRMSDSVVLIATTNLYAHFDRALVRRFDYVVDFDRYQRSDLISLAEKFMSFYLQKMRIANKDVRLLRKILSLKEKLPYPGELRNMIKSSIAFSDPSVDYDYLRRIYSALQGHMPKDPQALSEQGFTVREIGQLVLRSKSGVGRLLQAGGEK